MAGCQISHPDIIGGTAWPGFHPRGSAGWFADAAVALTAEAGDGRVDDITCARPLGLVIVDVDWDLPELVEAAHWHPGRSADPTLQWLRGILREMSSALESAPGVSAELSA